MASGKQLRFFDVPQCLAARVALAGFALTCLVTATTVQSSPLAGGRYVVEGAVARSGAESGMVADITVLDRASGETRQITVPLDWRGDQLEASVIADRTLIVIEKERYGQAVTIVDVLTGTVVDRIVGSRISLTADKTRAVYLQYYPPHNFMDDVVVVYDFTRSPRENFSPGFSSEALARFAGKGIILFPPENRARLEYTSKSDPLKVVVSPIAWCNDDRVAFLASTLSVRRESGCTVTVPASDTHLIEMSVPADAWQAKVIADRLIDAEQFRGPETSEWPLSRPLPYVNAKELRYSEDCQSVTIVPYGSPFKEEAVTVLAARPTGVGSETK